MYLWPRFLSSLRNIKKTGWLHTQEYGAVSYWDQPDFMVDGLSNCVDETAKPSTPEKSPIRSVAAVSEESALLSQLSEACQLSSTLQRGLDMCSSINAASSRNKALKNYSTETTAATSEHPVARQLDELRHLYRQVWATALGISTVANDIGPLLGYISPSQAMYQGWYIRMIYVMKCFI